MTGVPMSAGKGAKGHRFYDWAWIGLAARGDEPAGHRWLLVRRNRRTGELAFYRCSAPGRVPLATLVLLAHAFLTIVTVTARARPAPSELIPLTLNEIRHLHNALVVTPAANIAHIPHW